MKLNYIFKDLDKVIVKHIIPLLKRYKIFAIYGPLGVGKTTLIKLLFKHCGITQIVTSPTFNYFNCYKGKGEVTFYHFDLYKIQSQDEFIAYGFDELLYKNKSYVFIEWPEVIESLLENKEIKSEVCKIFLEYDQSIYTKRFMVVKDIII
jgi:tRNA threonylcarbamoyladenosine biosynthesis protein TsaE